MRVKRLEVTGFKSFLEKTTFDFNANLTGVVGPNGCGKSNIVDAIKWVTGELSFKELRGKGMEDLIFSGTDLRPPTGMAEVAMTLDNSDGKGPPQYKEYSEITVLRRVFRDGSSEFFINKIESRLRDIIDIFLDTGVGQSSYSIIEQGRIGMIVSSKPEDRRGMIEEAAGITKYKHRKDAAERKIEYTKQNLLRVSDILNELKRQTGALERQARKAEKFREARERAQRIDVALARRTFGTVLKQVEQLKELEIQARGEMETSQTELLAHEAAVEQLRLSATDLEKELEVQQHERFAQSSRIQAMESEISRLRAEHQRLLEMAQIEQARIVQLEVLQREVNEQCRRLEMQLGDLQSTSTRLNESLDSEVSELEAMQTQIRNAEETSELQKTEMIQLVSRSAELRNQLATGEEQLVQIDREIAVRIRELDSAEAELRELETSHSDRQKLLVHAQQLRLGFERDQKTLLERLTSLRSEISHTQDTLGDLERKREGQQSRLEALVDFAQTLQGYREGVRAVMERREEPAHPASKVKGLLGEMIRPARGYERAVQAALSDRVECLVIDQPRDALDVVSFLRGEGRGRGAFLPRGFAREVVRGALDGETGFLGWLDRFIESSELPQKTVESIFAGVAVVDQLDRAISFWERGQAYTFVTLEGDLVTKDGMVFGGSWTGQRGVFETKREIEELREELVRQEDSRKQLHEALSTLTQVLAGTEAELRQVEDSLQSESRRAFDHEKDFERLDEALKRARQAVEIIRTERKRWEDEKIQVTSSRTEAAREYEGVESQQRAVDTRLMEMNEELIQMRVQLSAKSEAVTQLKIEQAANLEKLESQARESQGLEKQRVQTVTELSQLLQASAQHVEEANPCLVKAEEIRIERMQAIQIHEELDRQITLLRTQHDAQAEEVRVRSLSAKEMRDSLFTLSEKLNQTRIQLTEETLRIEQLTTQIWERYGLRLTDPDTEAWQVSDEELSSLETELPELRERMAKMGDVHLGAIDELKELEERYHFMASQKEDLEKTIESLATAIRKINSTTRDRFAETFEAVNQKFQETFPKLFRGGKAKLVLVDPENLLETGIDIVARPPGKRLQNMNLLSGGEKALTAIALLFAVFQYKAPPFCLLDEVDAPLDDSNVRRYLTLVQEMSEQTQFIMITHNKTSIESAQNLYGITMEEPGVSRTVSVRLQSAAAALADSPAEESQRSVA